MILTKSYKLESPEITDYDSEGSDSSPPPLEEVEINQQTLSPLSPHPSVSFNIDLILPPNTPFHPPPHRGNPLTDPLTLNLGHWALNSPGYGYLDDPFEAYAINLEQNTRLKNLAYSAFLAALLVKSHHPRSEFSLKLSILRLYLAIHGVPLIYSVHCSKEDIKYVLDGELTEVYEWVFVGRENGRNHHDRMDRRTGYGLSESQSHETDVD